MNSDVLKKFGLGAVSLLMHFTHGGLLVTGLLVAALVFMHVGGDDRQWSGLQEIGRVLTQDRMEKPDNIPEAKTALSVEERTVAEYLSRRYRVSAAAIEPLVFAAVDAGERARLDPLLILAVMAIESGFNPIAESPMGAQGLMQVIPRFHQDKLEKLSADSLLDPVVNIQVGALVLKESIRRAGSLEDGLQQYAGAVSDDEGLYAAKVLAEKQRIEVAARRGRA